METTPILAVAIYDSGGVYEASHSRKYANRWHLRSTGNCLDRAAKWYGDVCAMIGALRGKGRIAYIDSSNQCSKSINGVLRVDRRDSHANELQAQPLDHARALSAHFYVGEESEARDRVAVFTKSWQLIAHAAQLDAAGDHVIGEIAGVPLLLVRDADGELRALHNVCRHRAGPLALCDGRGAKRLRCYYHGWSYALDGRLLSAPEMDGVADFDIAAIRLPQARVVEWHGLVFANLDDDAPSLDEVLDGIASRLDSHAIESYVFHSRQTYDIACNWKTYIDNYLEGYHVPHIHPALNRMLDYRDYVVETARWHSLQHSPLDSGEALYGSGEARYWFVWPNTMLNVMPGRLQTNRVLPLGPQRCRIVFDYYYPPDAAALAERHAQDQAFSDLVQREDVDMCEHVQRGLASGSYAAGRLNPLRENGVHHFHELLRAAYRGV